MSLHIAVPHFHLPHLSRRAIVRTSVGAAAAVLLLAADAAGYTVTAVALMLGAVAAWQVTDRYWRRRYERYASAFEQSSRALGQQLAQYERVYIERFDAEVAERNGKWPALNESRTGAGVL